MITGFIKIKPYQTIPYNYKVNACPNAKNDPTHNTRSINDIVWRYCSKCGSKLTEQSTYFPTYGVTGNLIVQILEQNGLPFWVYLNSYISNIDIIYYECGFSIRSEDVVKEVTPELFIEKRNEFLNSDYLKKISIILDSHKIQYTAHYGLLDKE